MPAINCAVVLHAGIAASPGGVGNPEEQIFGFEGLYRSAVFHGAGGEIGIAQDGVHEVVGHAHGVIGVLEKDGAVGFGVGRRTVVSERNQRVSFSFFFGLAFDEVNDVGMVHVQDHHLGGATSLASGFDDAGERVKALHKAERAAGGAAATESFIRRAKGRQIAACA